MTYVLETGAMLHFKVTTMHREDITFYVLFSHEGNFHTTVNILLVINIITEFLKQGEIFRSGLLDPVYINGYVPRNTNNSSQKILGSSNPSWCYLLQRSFPLNPQISTATIININFEDGLIK